MKIGWFKLFFVVMCLLCVTSCMQSNPHYPQPESYTEADIPYDAMSEEDAAFIWRLWNVDDWASYLVGDPGLQEAIFADGKCVYVNQLGGVGATDTIPEDAVIWGRQRHPAKRYTTRDRFTDQLCARRLCVIRAGIRCVPEIGKGHSICFLSRRSPAQNITR